MTGLYSRERVKYQLKKGSTSLLWKIFRFLLLLGISYIFLFPVLYMVSIAVRSPESVNDPSCIWIPRGLSWESIATAMEVLKYGESVTLTAIIALGGTLGSLVSCSLVGYGFARFRFAEKNFLFVLVLITIIVPPQNIVLSSFLNFRFFDVFGLMKVLHAVIPAIPDHINLINTPWTFILPSFFASGLRAGLFIYIFRQFFSGMPDELEQAARIDGCGHLSTYVRIMLPLARPAFVTVLLFSFVWHWNDYYLSAIYFSNTMPISVMLMQMQALLQDANLFNFVTNTPDQIRTYLQAGCLLTILPPLVIYLFTQRFFTESIERTGIVG